MEFYHLRSFVVVAETKNLTKAAKQLCSTPPAISAHIKALEQELAIALFIRSPKGMTLTEKGELLLAQAQKTLDSAVDMVNLAVDKHDELIGHFSLGINQPSQSLKISELYHNLLENCPGISLTITPSVSGVILEQIKSQALDGGYIYGDVPEEFTGIVVKHVAITTIAPKGFVTAKINIANELADFDWITMDKYCPFDTVLKQKLGTKIHAKIQSSDELSRLDLVRNGVGLSFLELTTAQHHQMLGEVELFSELDFSLPLNFVVQTKRLNEPIIKALCQEIRILWNISL